MNRVLLIVGAIVLAVALLFGGAIGYAVYQGTQLDASSKAYVQANVPPIISTWSEGALLRRSSPQLLRAIHAKRGELNELFHKLATLGSMRGFGPVKGQSNFSLTTQHGKVITANYIANATFAHGKARIRVRLIRLSGHWKFLRFAVYSPIFLR